MSASLKPNGTKLFYWPHSSAQTRREFVLHKHVMMRFIEKKVLKMQVSTFLAQNELGSALKLEVDALCQNPL